jgi:hypothetical protein
MINFRTGAQVPIPDSDLIEKFFMTVVNYRLYNSTCN